MNRARLFAALFLVVLAVSEQASAQRGNDGSAIVVGPAEMVPDLAQLVGRQHARQAIEPAADRGFLADGLTQVLDEDRLPATLAASQQAAIAAARARVLHEYVAVARELEAASPEFLERTAGER